jgi:hypothetical protein
MEKRRNLLKALLGLGGLSAAKAAEAPQAAFSSGLKLFFAFRDTVINFNINTGVGDHCGTVEGVITGTSITNFQFVPTSQTTITYDNRCMITDLDGDQIIFRVQGTGQFIIPPPTDSSSTLGNLMALGGPLVATMTVVKATGIFLFLVGRKFPCKMAASNVISPSAGVLGNVYGEVYTDTFGLDSGAIQEGRTLRASKMLR